MKKTIDDISVAGRRVLVRLDLNVPIDEAGEISDDRRIRAALPTIRELLGDGGQLVLMSHLGRPKGDGAAGDDAYSMGPVAERLGELLDQEVPLAPDCVGDAARKVVDRLVDGRCCLLENLRFHTAETIRDKDAAKDDELRRRKEEFARQLADMGDVYVNDAFGTCHRDNASMLTVPRMMEGKPRVVGYLVKKELAFLGDSLAEPKRPFVAILGGAKVSDKLGVIEHLLGKCDRILIGGAMSYTFLAARGVGIGKSLFEPDLIDTAKSLMEKSVGMLMLPEDSVCAAEIKGGGDVRTVEGAIPDGLMGLDIGPVTRRTYAEALKGAGTIVWNGPMGVFEHPPFDAGTVAVAEAVASATDGGAISIVGGGDSAAAIDEAGLEDRITHISTGGGASLEFLEGKSFAAIEVLDDA